MLAGTREDLPVNRDLPAGVKDNTPAGLLLGPRHARKQQGIISVNRAHAGQNSISLEPESLDTLPGVLRSDPLGFAGSRGNPSVQRHRALENHER